MNNQLRILEAQFFQVKDRLQQALAELSGTTFSSENWPFRKLQDECNGSSITDHISRENPTFARIIRPSLKGRIKAYFKEEIGEDLLLEAELLVLSFATGIEDSITFPDYHCFVSNQTGNTVLFAVGVSGVLACASNASMPLNACPSGTVITGISDYVILPNAGISLSMFIMGGWILGQLGNYFGCYRRGWLLASSTFQTLLVIIAVNLQRTNTNYFIQSRGPGAWIIIALLALSSGAQVAMVRSLQLGTEITTANATSSYVDTFIDTRMFQWKNRPRNRRMLFLLFICGGSFAGAYAHKNLGSWEALSLTAGAKTLAIIGMFFNKRDASSIVTEEYESELSGSITEVEKENGFGPESTERLLPLPSLPLPILSPLRLSPQKLARPSLCRACYSRIDRMSKGNNVA